MVIAIPTKNRTVAFRRCLESIRDNANKYSREIEFLVVDDSDAEGYMQANKQSLKDTGVPYRYYDRDDVASFAEHLSREAECPLYLTQFLLQKNPSAHGAVRNFLMLMSLDKPLVMVDDDMVCKFADIPNRKDEIEYALTPKRVVYPLSKLIDEVDESKLIDEDFLGKHEDLLNKVPLSIGNSVGDSGVTHSYVFLGARDIVAQLAEHPETLIPKLCSKQMMRVILNPTIVEWSCCVGMSFGLNTAQSLPPFFPVGRSEDVLFGGMLRSCYKHLSGYCNYSMWHTPRRPDTEEKILTLGETTPPEFIHKLLVEINPTDLNMLGETLVAISHQDMVWIEEMWKDNTCKRLDTLCEGVPDLLVREIRKVRDVIRQAPPYNVPYNLMKQFGELLLVWPRIVEVAKYGIRVPVRLRASPL